jgi:copper chaperone CopZ
MVEAVRCDLCGLESNHPLTREIDGRLLHFCCAGCWQVYELQRDEMPGPDHAAAATPAAAGMEALLQDTAPAETITLPIVGMTCTSCVSNVQRALKALPGVRDAVVNLELATASVKYDDGRVSIADMQQALLKAGYASPGPDHGPQRP